MKKYNGLLAEIAREFHIEQGEAESMERWKARIVYSLLGRMAYASLYDHLEEDEELPEDNQSEIMARLNRYNKAKVQIAKKLQRLIL